MPQIIQNMDRAWLVVKSFLYASMDIGASVKPSPTRVLDFASPKTDAMNVLGTTVTTSRARNPVECLVVSLSI